MGSESENEFEDALYSDIDASFEDNMADGDMSDCYSPAPQEEFEVISVEEVNEFLEKKLKEVEIVIESTRTNTRTFMCHFNWDKQNLFDAYLEDQEKFFKDLGLQVIDTEDDAKEGTSKQNDNDCQVCFSQEDGSILAALKCGHTCCDSCWKEYLQTEIKRIGIIKTLTCPGYRCETIVDDDTFKRFVTDPNCLSLYEESITNKLVKSHPCLKWCPGPGCNLVIKADYAKVKEVQCTCGYSFCFACGKDSHKPLECHFLIAWEQAKEAADRIYKETFSKKCPNTKCGVVIEKEDGCDHMTCPECKHEFCWLCMGERDGFNPHIHVYNIEMDQKQLTEDQIIKLSKFNYYELKTTNHIILLDFEKDFLKTKTLEIQTSLNKHPAELQFMKKAAEALTKCRNTLKNTYIFSYFVDVDNQSEIFEDNQRNLQEEVEKLSSILTQNDVDNASFDQFRVQMENVYRYCEQRRIALLEHAQEGYDKNFWKFGPLSMF